MTIGLLQIDCTIPGSRSLKEKRRAVKSLKTLLGNRFNCSVAEIEFKDMWARSQLAVCVVSVETGHVSAQLSEIVRFASNHHAVLVEDYTIEMI